MKKISIIGIALIAWLSNACSKSSGEENAAVKSEVIPVQVIPLQKKSMQPTLKVAGQFSTDDETNLAFKTGGVIARIFVKEGDAVRKGQLLATLNLTEINAQVTQAQLALEKATRDFNRVANLYKDSVATLEQFQNAKTGLEVARQQLQAAQFNQSYSEIRAVTDGFVLKKMANEGQVVSPGTTVFQTNGAKRGHWVLKAAISDREWALLKLNDAAEVHLDALPNEKFKAYVSRKSGGTDASTGSFTVELTLHGKLPSAIASGMFGKASITPSSQQEFWFIPYEALLDGDEKTGYVFVTHDGKTARKIPVQIASVDRDYILVDGGLDSATSLIVSGSAYLREGSAIEVRN
jgi:RND family efflux transporter MFP subunit